MDDKDYLDKIKKEMKRKGKFAVDVAPPQTDTDKDKSQLASAEHDYSLAYVWSIIIPLVGFIMGGILFTKGEEYKKPANICMCCGIGSIVICAVLAALIAAAR